MKVITALTVELDDREKALSDIKEQIKAGGEQGKNTVGLVYCHYEFVLTGIAEYICDNLPFDVVGSSTTLCAVNAPGMENEHFRFVLTILTGDEDFGTFVTEPLTPESDADAVCDRMFPAGFNPKLALMLMTTVRVTDVDELVDAAVRKLGDAPVFGGCAVDDSPTYTEHCFVFKNGDFYEDRAVFLTLSGDITPHFTTTVVNRASWLADVSDVTKAKGNALIEVNNRPIKDYIERFGIPVSLADDGIVNSAIFIVNDGGGDYYGRSMLGMNEDGSAMLLGGRITTGSKITLSTFEKQGVFAASINSTREMLKNHKNPTLAFVVSCETRHVVLGANGFDGDKMLKDEFGDIPYMFAYQGGEICTVAPGKSRVMNHSYCVCLI
jgi:hypothetical protein